MVHADIKIENIFATDNKGYAHCAVAYMAGGGYHTTLVMAPEQACTNYKTWTGACDVWAAGVVLHQLCTLNRPLKFDLGNGRWTHVSYAAAAFAGYEFKIRNAEWRFGAAGATFQRLISTMLQLNPAHRPTVKQLLQDPDILAFRQQINFCLYKEVYADN